MVICEDPNFLKVLYLIAQILNIVFCFVPILLIIMVSIDIFKDIMDPSKIKNTVNIVKKRLIASLLIFFIYNFLILIMSSISNDYVNDFTNCLNNANPTFISEAKETYKEKKLAQKLAEDEIKTKNHD